MDDFARIVDKRADELAKKKNVVAVAVGEKWVNGKSTGKPAIIVLVEKKEPLSQLKAEDKIPSKVDGAITDVVGKVGKIEKFGYTKRYRPAPAGVSCGHPWITAGTIGGYFRDRSGSLVALTNNHIAADENKGKPGHSFRQPGPYDGATRRDIIGNLKAYERLIKPNQKVRNRHLGKSINYNLEDSAIAKIKSSKLILNSIAGIGTVRGFNLTPRIGITVQKSGRTTGRTRGKIIGLRATVYVTYDMGTLIFKDQILTNDMSRGGDSGSLLLDSNRKAVGLLFAGSSTITVHNRIYYPIKSYGLRLIGSKPKSKSRPPKRRGRRRRRRRRICGWQRYWVRRGRRRYRRRRWRCRWA